jgi:hypothetical protein
LREIGGAINVFWDIKVARRWRDLRCGLVEKSLISRRSAGGLGGSGWVERI